MEEDRVSEEKTSGVLILNGEAWKNRNQRTYTSLLDQYGVSDLFSEKSVQQYQKQQEKERTEHEELTAFVFSGQLQMKDEGEDLIDLIFAEELQFTKTRDYSREEEDYSICFAMAELLFVIVFIYLLMKINVGRRKRREAHAAEIDMESEGQEGYGSAGVS